MKLTFKVSHVIHHGKKPIPDKQTDHDGWKTATEDDRATGLSGLLI